MRIESHVIPTMQKHLGVGDRATELQLEEISFDALRNLFVSDDFFRARPFRGSGQALDFVQAAREEGANIVQSFHERVTSRGGHRYAILADVCALANANGGTVYIGVSENAREKPVGVTNPIRVVDDLQQEISTKITPTLQSSFDTISSQGKKVVRVTVPRGDDPPYAIDDNKVYVRTESDTSLAVRDEIVQLVLRTNRSSLATLPVTLSTDGERQKIAMGKHAQRRLALRVRVLKLSQAKIGMGRAITRCEICEMATRLKM